MNIGLINPYRYRGYRYDNETGLYYLQSRYYNPEWGRFINADGLVSTGQGLLSNNMYTYCYNNPVNLCDPTGTLAMMVQQMQGKNPRPIEGGMPAPKSPAKSTPKFSTPTSGVYNSNFSNVSIVENSNLMSSVPSGNVIVIDDRGSKNANMQVRDSYKITNANAQKKVLETMLIYNKMYPSENLWNRTMESLIIEWDAHNILSVIPIEILQNRFRHADFDNNQEAVFKEIYNYSKIIQSDIYRYQKGKMMFGF